MTQIKLTWHGHSCFSIANDQYSLVIDPYQGDKIGYPPLNIKAHAMLSSHDHHDHNCKAAVEFLAAPEGILKEIDLAQAWPLDPDPDIFYFKKLFTKHDEAGGTKRGSNTIHIILSAGVKIAHFGDLGHELTDEQRFALADLDLALIPVGGYYTIDAGQAYDIVRQIRPANVIPMHFTWQHGSLPIATVEPFIYLVRSLYHIERISGAELIDAGANAGRCYVFSSMVSQS